MNINKYKVFIEYGKSLQKLKEAWRFVRKFPTPKCLEDVRYTDKYVPDLDSNEFRSFMDSLNYARQKRRECEKFED